MRKKLYDYIILFYTNNSVENNLISSAVFLFEYKCNDYYDVMQVMGKLFSKVFEY